MIHNHNSIRLFPNPLSLYVFYIQQAFAKQIINRHSFSGGAINDTLIRISPTKTNLNTLSFRAINSATLVFTNIT